MSGSLNTALVRRDDKSNGTRNRSSSKSWWEVCCTWAGLGCCVPEERLEEKPIAEVTPNKDRNCTDIPCCLFLLAVLASQVVLIFYASSKGADPEYLVHGTDYLGNLCKAGYDKGRFTAWPALNTTDDIRVCVTDCAFTNNTSTDNQTKMVDNYPSETFLDAWCVPKEAYLDNTTASYSFDSDAETLNRAIRDLNISKWLILGSAFIAVFISFLYIKFINCLGRCLLILSIIAVFVGGFFVGLWLIRDGILNLSDSDTKRTGEAEIVLGAIVFVLWVLFFMALFWMRSRIDLALNMLNEASRAVRDLPTTVIFPVMYSFVGIAYFAFWLVVAMYVFSCKEKVTKNTPENLIGYFGYTYIDVTFNKDLQNALIYHLLCLVYLAQVISYFGFMVLAGVFADWYFSAWNPSQSRKMRGYGTGELSGSPVCESLFRVLRFHLGSLALGALVVTPVRLIRWILMSIRRSTQNAQNGATRCILGCTNCCLQCLECFLDKINQEGFILTSIYGTNFCHSSLVAVKLIYTNVLRTALLEGISHYIEFFGRITIAAVTTGICLSIFSLNNYFRDNLSSVLSPGIAVFVIAYIIGSLFMLVYEVAVDTIFLCYLIDEQTHPEGPKFAHEDLAKMATRHKNSV